MLAAIHNASENLIDALGWYQDRFRRVPRGDGFYLLLLAPYSTGGTLARSRESNSLPQLSLYG